MYEGLGTDFDKRGVTATLIGDVFQNIYHAVRTIAVDKKKALSLLEKEWAKVVLSVEKDNGDKLFRQLKSAAKTLSTIETTSDFQDVAKIAIVGEIFVRNDEFSRVDLLEKFYERNLIPKVEPISEYVHYSNYMIGEGLTTEKFSLKDKLRFQIRKHVQLSIEKKIRGILSRSGLCDNEVTNVDEIIKKSEHLVDPELAGEAILTVGSALHEIVNNVSGVISIGPFGCMPSRVAESILNIEMNVEGKEAAEKKKIKTLDNHSKDFPYLAIETDGNLYPQIIQSKIEIFILQAERLHKQLSVAGIKTKTEQAFKFKKLIERTLNGHFRKMPGIRLKKEEIEVEKE
jgi:predicted nucleotide-binding protein (sugar kinase/HSP70/actin superfamily)